MHLKLSMDILCARSYARELMKFFVLWQNNVYDAMLLMLVVALILEVI